jgi:hypothetical protein
MAATALGNPLTTRVVRKDSGRKTRAITGNGSEYRYTQKCGTAVSNALGEADPNDATIVLKRIDFEPQPGGGYETVILTYEPATQTDTRGSVGPVGTIVFEADANVMEIPIQQHPNFYEPDSYRDPDTGVYHANLNTNGSGPGTDHPGVESFQVPQPTFTRTEVLTASTFEFTQAAIIANVGMRNVPTGMTGTPTENLWLKTRLSLRKNGATIEKTETWQYAAAGWEPNIYKKVTSGGYG